jgi:hypothetical protein
MSTVKFEMDAKKLRKATRRIRMDKVVRGGKTAVLYSPNYGAGWVSCNEDVSPFSSRIVKAVLGESDETPLEAAEAEYPNAYHGGVADLQVEWVDVGDRFEIAECDGYESVRILSPSDGYIA